MKKLPVILIVIACVSLALCGLANSLAASLAGLANGVAVASLGSAIATSQCSALIMMLVALGGGLAIGAAVNQSRLRSSLRSARLARSTSLASIASNDDSAGRGGPKLPAPKPADLQIPGDEDLLDDHAFLAYIEDEWTHQ